MAPLPTRRVPAGLAPMAARLRTLARPLDPTPRVDAARRGGRLIPAVTAPLARAIAGLRVRARTSAHPMATGSVPCAVASRLTVTARPGPASPSLSVAVVPGGGRLNLAARPNPAPVARRTPGRRRSAGPARDFGAPDADRPGAPRGRRSAARRGDAGGPAAFGAPGSPGTPGRDWDAPRRAVLWAAMRRSGAVRRARLGLRRDRRRTASPLTGTRSRAGGPPGRRPSTARAHPRRAGPARRAGTGIAAGRQAAANGHGSWDASPSAGRMLLTGAGPRAPVTGMRRRMGGPGLAALGRGTRRPARAGRMRPAGQPPTTFPLTGMRPLAGGPTGTPRPTATARGTRRPRRAGTPPPDNAARGHR
jgi:hypothetical protein